MKLIKYLFPAPRLIETIRRPAAGYSAPYQADDPERALDIDLLLFAGAARTRGDAQRLLDSHPDLTVEQLIRQFRRSGRTRDRPLKRAWRRWLKLWRK